MCILEARKPGPFRGRSPALFALLAILLTSIAAAAQQQPSSEPILQVETGMHTGRLTRASVDAAGRILATAADDKTVRLWSLATGEQIRVLRLPIGDGNEGKLFSVAVSPDGKWVAAGGWTGYQWEHQDCIYLFEIDGRLARRITGLPNVINELKWSHDGRLLAVGLGGKNGIRVFRSEDWKEVARDTDYAEQAYGLDFDSSGRLAAKM